MVGSAADSAENDCRRGRRRERRRRKEEGEAAARAASTSRSSSAGAGEEEEEGRGASSCSGKEEEEELGLERRMSEVDESSVCDATAVVMAEKGERGGRRSGQAGEDRSTANSAAAGWRARSIVQ